MNLYNAIMYLHPTAVNKVDFSLRNDSGVDYIYEWNLLDPIPTDAELIAASDAYDAAQAITDANNAIYAELDAIDLRMIRALGEGDTARIADYNAQKATLRSQLQ